MLLTLLFVFRDFLLETLPSHLQSLINKRRTFFFGIFGNKKKKLENFGIFRKRKNSRIDVYMQWLTDFTNKQIYDIDDKDVLDFLIFKDVNQFRNNISSSRHAVASMRIGIVLKLR